MRRQQKKEAELRAKKFLLFTFAKIVAEITIIIGFFIVGYILIKRYFF